MNKTINSKIAAKTKHQINKFLQKASRENISDNIAKSVSDALKEDIKNYGNFNEAFKFIPDENSTDEFKRGCSILGNYLNNAYDNNINSELKQEFIKEYFNNKQPRCCICGQLLDISRNIIHVDLDHFLPKRKYPQFSLTPENFIPTCLECNQREKKDKFIEISELKLALNELNINLEPPIELWKNIQFDFSFFPEPALQIEKDAQKSNGLKLVKIYSIDKRYNQIIKHCYSILFSQIKYSDIRSPESLERFIETLAFSNWQEINDGYSINNSPQIWQEFLEWILYSESNLLALWEEVKDYSVQYSNYCNL